MECDKINKFFKFAFVKLFGRVENLVDLTDLFKIRQIKSTQNLVKIAIGQIKSPPNLMKIPNSEFSPKILFFIRQITLPQKFSKQIMFWLHQGETQFSA